MAVFFRSFDVVLKAKEIFVELGFQNNIKRPEEDNLSTAETLSKKSENPTRTMKKFEAIVIVRFGILNRIRG